MPWPKRIVVALWVATGLCTVLGAWASVAAGRGFDYGVFLLSAGTAVVPLVAGWLVIAHAPDNWVGASLTSGALAIMLINAHGTWQEALASDPGSLPSSTHFWVLSQGVWMAWFVPHALTISLFPDGRPRGRVGRWSVVGLLVVPVLFNLLTAVIPGPLMPPLDDWPRPFGTHWVGYGSLALLPVFLAALVGSAVSLFRRHRELESAGARAQVRWMLLGAAVVPATLVLCWAGYLVWGSVVPLVVGLVAMETLVPVAALVAMLRHDLYDVDRAIVLAGTHAVLALGVVGGYAFVSALVGRALGADSVTAAVVATAAVAVVLLPARAFLLRVLGRWLHPRGAAGVAAVRDLADRVNTGAGEPEELEAVLRVALRDPGLRVGYRRPGGTAYVDLAGREVEAAGGRRIVSLGHDVGVVVPSTGAAVPSDVVEMAALLADSVRLRLELASALAEVDASRQRLLRAGYEERRRLEMDLHDGAQQQLVSLGMRLRVAQRHVSDGREVDVDALVERAIGEITDAVAELRSIAHGLRPSSLDDGLPAALDTLTRSSALPVDLTYAAGELPDHVSLTAWYVANEAVTNAVKHASASSVCIEVRHAEEQLRVLVRDDGSGGAQIVPGSGLARLHDRVAALGGSLSVRSGHASGTWVEAVIPCGS